MSRWAHDDIWARLTGPRRPLGDNAGRLALLGSVARAVEMWPAPELRAALGALGLDQRGERAALVVRLRRAYALAAFLVDQPGPWLVALARLEGLTERPRTVRELAAALLVRAFGPRGQA